MRAPTSSGAPGPPRRRTARRLATSAGVALAIAACGSGSDEALPADAAAPDATIGAATDAGSVAETDDGSDADTATANSPDVAVATGPGLVDLVGAEVVPAAEIETNSLPSVVVDDLNNEREVNFRNLVPQETPILLWAWAPH
ncbi:hypothetical protein [Ilumatobacter sp.]|uniref:hypothetical protein n=1 Tax=Ilumatobacter sp. TaxID=1967498 RepID=UPI003B523320